MSTTKSLSQLAALIQSHAVSIEEFLVSSGHPQPSFDANAPLGLPLTLDLENTRDELVEALDQLRALALGPMAHILTTMLPVPATNATLHAIYHFRIPQHIGLNESVSYSVLAERCGLTEDDLRCYLRMAISMRLFEADPSDPNLVRHNGASSIFVALPPTHDFLGMLTEDMSTTSLKMVEASTRFRGSQEPNESAASVAMGFGGKKDFYSAIAGDEERVRRVASSMSMGAKFPTHAVRHFVENCGWDQDGKCPRRIVDIGGSEGELCKAFLRKYEWIEEAVSLDRAEVVQGLEIPEELKGRLRFEPYDFFKAQDVVKGADAYIFRNCFHNWSDKYALQMLRNQIPALTKGARVYINETCLPEIDEIGLVKGRVAWASDLIMKMSFNGKDRSKQDWKNLFKAADERFTVVSIKTPPQSAMSIIEVVWEG